MRESHKQQLNSVSNRLATITDKIAVLTHECYKLGESQFLPPELAESYKKAAQFLQATKPALYNTSIAISDAVIKHCNQK